MSEILDHINSTQNQIRNRLGWSELPDMNKPMTGSQVDKFLRNSDLFPKPGLLQKFKAFFKKK
jgi:hypothetical protein